MAFDPKWTERWLRRSCSSVSQLRTIAIGASSLSCVQMIARTVTRANLPFTNDAHQERLMKRFEGKPNEVDFRPALVCWISTSVVGHCGRLLQHGLLARSRISFLFGDKCVLLRTVLDIFHRLDSSRRSSAILEISKSMDGVFHIRFGKPSRLLFSGEVSHLAKPKVRRTLENGHLAGRRCECDVHNSQKLQTG